MEFEWDENKSRKNLDKHGLLFRDALWIFDGRFRWTREAHERGEARFASTAETNGIYYTAIWTYRGTKIRLISMRRARDEEEREHRELYGRRGEADDG